jgi:hypothetical protein
METSIYQTTIANARLLALETLRTRNIHKWIRENADLTQRQEGNLQLLEIKKETIKEAELNVRRKEYALSKLETNNPDFESVKKILDATLADANAYLEETETALTRTTEDATKANLELDKQIAENNTKIGRWESGENKVQLENLNELAREYVEICQNEKAKNLV